VELHQLRPERDLTLEDEIERSVHYSQLRRQAAQRPAMPRPSLALTGMSALTVAAAATLPSLLRGHRAAVVTQHAEAASAATPAPLTRSVAPVQEHTQFTRRLVVHHRVLVRSHGPRHAAALPTRAVHPKPTKAPAPRAIVATTRQPATQASGGVGLTAAPRKNVAAGRTRTADPKPTTTHAATTHATTHHARHASGGVGVRATSSPPTTTQTSNPAPVAAGGYVNPLAHARVTPERIDQGVDYSGSGTLTALGAGRVTYVATSGTGWPGAFIEYRLTSGAYAGRYVFYAEHVTPAPGLRLGETLRPGQPVATMSGGIEVGWGAGIGTETYARANGQWPSGADSRNYASPAGRSFSALIASLGGPPGKVEG
jgi:hypothetical protein